MIRSGIKPPPVPLVKKPAIQKQNRYDERKVGLFRDLALSMKKAGLRQ